MQYKSLELPPVASLIGKRNQEQVWPKIWERKLLAATSLFISDLGGENVENGQKHKKVKFDQNNNV